MKLPRTFKDRDIRRIWEIFVRPIAARRPSEANKAQWLDTVWGVEHRRIVQYQVTNWFTMPGLQKMSHIRHIQGVGINIHVGCRLFVRFDDENPDQIEVQACVGGGQSERIYLLDPREWAWIQKFIEVVPPLK